MHNKILQQLGLMYSASSAATSQRYTNTVTHDLDLPRLLQGKKDCWRFPKTISQLKKKKIILTRPENQGFEQDTLMLWTALLHQGYELYAYTETFTPIRTQADLVRLLPQTMPPSPRMTQQLADVNISRDEAFVAYPRQVEKLLHSFPKATWQRNASDPWYQSVNAMDLKDAYEFLDKSEPVEVTIDSKEGLQNWKSKENQSVLQSILKGKVFISLKYDKNTDSSLMEESGLLEPINQLIINETRENLPFNKLMSLIKACAHLKHLVFSDYAFQPGEFAQLLNACPGLTGLDLGQASLEKGFTQQLEKKALKSLTYLNLNLTSIEDDDYIRLIHHAPNLRELISPPASQITSPETVVHQFSTRTVANLASYLPKLKKGKFIHYLNHPGIMESDTFGFKSFTLSPTLYSLTEDRWRFVMQRMPQLEHLKINNDFNPDDTFFSELGEFPRLTHLEVTQGSRITQGLTNERIGLLLSRCPQLCSLRIESNAVIDNLTGSLQPKGLNNLLYLNLASPVSASGLASLLNASVQLMMLTVRHINAEKGDFSFNLKPESLALLRGLHIACDENSKLFILLINQARQLTELNFEHVDDFPLAHSTELVQNDSLQRLSLKGVTNQKGALDIFLQKFPSITQLTLTSCSFDAKNGLQLPKLPALENLRELVIIKTLITNDVLAAILNRCKQLTSLSISVSSTLLTEDLLFMLDAEALDRVYTRFPDLVKKLPRSEINLSDVSDMQSNSLKGMNEYSSKSEYSTGGHSTSKVHHDLRRKNKPPKEIDKDTGLKNVDVSTSQVFYYKPDSKYPLPDHYRNQVFPKLQRKGQVKLVETNDKQFKAVKVDRVDDLKSVYFSQYETNLTYYLGKQLVSGETALPSLSPSDRLVGFETNPRVDVEIVYCEEENLYYVRSKDPSKAIFTVTYLIQSNYYYEMTQPAPALDKVNPEDILALQQVMFDENGDYLDTPALKKIRSYPYEQRRNVLMAFCQFDLNDLKGDTNSSVAILNSIIHERQGVCRHRTWAFMALADVLNLEARAIYNDCHAYIEVKEQGGWHRLDLGGAPVNQKIETLETSKPKSRAMPAKEQNNNNPAIVRKKAVSLDNNKYRTWDTLRSTATNYSHYADELLKAGAQLPDGLQTILCTLKSNQIESVHAALYQRVIEKKNRCFYINSLDDISEFTCVIDNATGDYHRVDSPVMRFVKEAKPGDVLCINWSNFEAQHVGYNSIMDKIRTLNGVKLPEGLTVIGVLPEGQVMGDDFYSRFRVKSQCSAALKGEPSIPAAVSTLTKEQENWAKIDFFGEDWESELKGQFQIQGERYQFLESELVAALKGNKPGLILRNAPWHDEAFRLFMREINLNRKITINGKDYAIPEHFQFIRLDVPYDYGLAKYTIENKASSSPVKQQWVLNAYTVNHLFKHYRVEKEGLVELPGLLAAYKNKTLPLHVTDTLSKEQWARIIMEAGKQNTSLYITCSPDVTIPAEMKTSQTAVKFSGDEEKLECKSAVIVTNDIHFAEKQLDWKDPLVIPVDEHTTYADLIENIAIRDGDNGKKRFNHQIGAIPSHADRSIVLKGRLSPVLARQIESLFLPDGYMILNGDRIKAPKNKLVLITDDVNPFPTARTSDLRYTHEAYWQALKKDYPKEVERLVPVCCDYYKLSGAKAFDYIQLATLLQFMKTHPQSNPLKQILRLEKTYKVNKPFAEMAWKNHFNKVKSDSVLPIMEKRREKLFSHLNVSPYVFIVGSSGVGKTTFIQQELKKAHGEDYALFTGLDKLSAWLQSGKEHNYLFIDEANLLAPGVLDRFEGLFSNPPSVLDGDLKPVSKKHQVIFAGNFGYFADRERHRFLADRGHVITFKELPDSFLTKHIIAPVAKPLFKDDHTTILNEVFLKTYHQVNSQFPDKHPVTARNLQMMVLRASQSHLKTGDMKTAACLAVYDEVSGMMNPRQRKELQKWLADNFGVPVKGIKADLKKQMQFKNDAFLMTKKRMNPLRLLHDAFNIREIKNSLTGLQAVGTCGLIFEAEAGEGKSRMAMEFLKSRNISPADPDGVNTKDNYYYLTPTDPAIMEKRLIKAFHEGAVVVIDEMNSLPLERVLNALLSGVDLDGKPAANPGFFVIGTQNPIHYGKRQALSDALLNRFQKVDLKPYSKDDLVLIKSQLLGSSEKAMREVDEFLAAREYALQEGLSPAPTPRDLFS
ncbi:hypothetical protein DIZ81_05315 [Legionella taurinensis]|uniref:F-box/LRR-repeat protein 15/At3g58940/PEG3-like LRR domain-containing protein n=1 Tax=Legionella taurinensis TaxID=70611 RepID=A0AB38N723_9GAMM|nr:hypothetical protein [Legionella taurinensis]MDX1837334.1 hypothetical protein [Legionella taurinensis]PUT40689.1 hypothetical protein DB744_05315 [Legionella taurinensis]PUT44111.1 hypothetical protein DB746_03715 [Legionella taurinensis]PUT47412.1 hypothetical protein DB743_01885 [Legionella taurinensis]PUT48551.1 hypothetical protein DB745_03715 [Legionella taurinensis]